METMTKKLLIAASLSDAALGTTPLFADPGHRRGQHQAGATENCQMGAEHRDHSERRAEMQKRMQEMHARMGPHEGQGSGTQGDHQH
jgi:hypothetical protein